MKRKRWVDVVGDVGKAEENEKPRGLMLGGSPRGYEITTLTGCVVSVLPGASVKRFLRASGRHNRKGR